MIPNNILNKIMKSNTIGITFHVSADGDSIGSSLALMQGLKRLGKDAYILSKEVIPDTFKFLPQNYVIDGNTKCIKENTELLIIIDTGDTKRINADIDLNNRNYTLINLDHHLTNENYGDMNFVDTKSSSMAEIVFNLLNELDVKIDKDIASCLYTSILTDTGGFKHSNTTNITHNIAGILIDTGIDHSEIYRQIFDNKPFNKVKLSGKIIENMELINNCICLMKITKDMLKEFGFEEGFDSGEVIWLGTQISSVEVTVLLKESDEGTKVSLRSKSKVDVRKITEKFSGGGHMRAAGCLLRNKNIDEAKQILLKEIEKELI